MTLVTGAGAFMLGLSWLIGGPIQEVITSIIFLFIKHPYDDGDRVCIEEEVYLVREIRLLSTIFMNKNGCLVQAPNSILSTKVRRISILPRKVFVDEPSSVYRERAP